MHLKDMMSTDLAYISVHDSIYEAACLMRDHNIGVIPVVDEDGYLIGVVTDRDLVIRGMAERRPNSLEAGKVMSSVLVKGTPEMSTEEASKIMADAQVRRLPIVDRQDRLVGIISLGDMAVHHSTQEVSYAMSEISKTHNPTASNDIQPSQMQ